MSDKIYNQGIPAVKSDVEILKSNYKDEFYTLYKKTHLITGMKYLGYTELADVIVYNGSGVKWGKHLEEHGDENVLTEVLLVTYSYDQLKAVGRYYSKLWNIVKSEEWANLRPETGKGGDTVSDKMWITDGNNERYILKENEIPEGWRKGRNSKCSFKDPRRQKENSAKADRSKQSETMKKLWKDPIFRDRIIKSRKK